MRTRQPRQAEATTQRRGEIKPRAAPNPGGTGSLAAGEKPVS